MINGCMIQNFSYKVKFLNVTFIKIYALTNKKGKIDKTGAKIETERDFVIKNEENSTFLGC